MSITIKGYKRHGYTRSDGTHVKATHVATHKRVDLGLPGHGPKTLPKISHPVEGYHTTMKSTQRHALLDKVPKAKILKIARDLQLLANYTARSQPQNAKKYKKDADYLFKKHHRE
jgi:hypothetical protein